MNNKNYEALHQFIEGLKGDFVENAESPQSYQNGVNGRLVSENGTLSFSSIKGTLEIYNNPNIVKYLGFWPFKDELVIFVKCLPGVSDGDGDGPQIETQEIENLVSNSFTVTIPFNDTSANIETLIDNNTSIIITEVPIAPDPIEDPFNFEQNISCVDGVPQEIDYSEYYTERATTLNYQVCTIGDSSTSFENNQEYIDCIFSLKKDQLGTVYDDLIWAGLLNWPLNGKIATVGIYENNFYKRVYFTDYVNSFRVINLKDPDISSRSSNEFDSFQNTGLLQPKIELIGNNGQLKSGTTIYTHRLITSNGQTTEFSPFSIPVRINSEDGDIDYSGGDISEITNKHVVVKCNVPGYQNYNEIEVVAIEYEALGSPTAIRSLGIKTVSAVNIFEHYGNESEFSEDITITELLQRKNSWKYCSDLASKGNKLFASGLRNDPIDIDLLNLQKDFSLHAWDENGETHECLLNPDPTRYRFINPLNTESYYYIKQRLYNSIQVFGDFTVSFNNQLTGYQITNSFEATTEQYEDFMLQIFDWIDSLQSTPDFIANFPNVKVELINGKMLLSPIDENIQTDFNNFFFTYNTTQVIEDFEEDIQFQNLDVGSALVYGGVSLGFNQGNGIRITFKTESEEVLEQSTDTFPEDNILLKLKEPSLKRGFMKGEIYRPGLQFFDNNGYQLFVIPLGDLKVPELGEFQRSLDDNGNPVYSSVVYRNSFTQGNKLYAERIIMNVEVRLSCKIQKLVNSYQLVYVERTENNRTILCQGISAPMERCNIFHHSEHISLKDEIANKWNLPYYGGPTYDGQGLLQYDEDPYQENEWDWNRRITTHRAMFYFDSPDLIYSRISSEKIKNGFIQRVGKLNTDHTLTAIRQSDGEVYPKFSRKIYKTELSGESTSVPRWMNVSVFSKETFGDKELKSINKSVDLNRAEIVSGSSLDVSQEISNYALTLGKQSWFYSAYARKSDACQYDNGARSELYKTNGVSPGYKTTIIKTDEDIFTDDFIAQGLHISEPEIRDPYDYHGRNYDTHGLFNIKLNNESSVYGGRSELAYSQNVYSPLSETIPVLKNSNGIQVFSVYGDTYTTLFTRLKNDYSDYTPGNKHMNNSGGCENKHEEDEYARWGAWTYAFVVETQVEERLTDKNRFYKESEPYDFANDQIELINEAYFQENNLRTYIPKPFRFKDDPNMGNIIAASNVKLNGDFIDSWTEFLTNNFYELEKDKGVVFNLAKQINEIYAIQENQTSLLFIDQSTMVPTEDGQSLSIKQGEGNVISDHRIISDYGTSIRRSIVENRFGFVFIDENKFEFVKIKDPLLVQRSLNLKFREIFENDPIVDVEGYYDDKYKESNLRIRTKNGLSFCLSFNEALKVFNGWMEYDNDIYMNWNDLVYSPLTTMVPKENNPNETRPNSSSLHQLNIGEYLILFGERKTMKLGVVCNINPTQVKIFKHWAGIINIDYNIKTITAKTNLGQTRIISGDHHRYKIREGRHSVPLKNRTDWDDLRGEWMFIEIEIDSLKNKKVDIFSFINFVRHSYQ